MVLCSNCGSSVDYARAQFKMSPGGSSWTCEACRKDPRNRHSVAAQQSRLERPSPPPTTAERAKSWSTWVYDSTGEARNHAWEKRPFARGTRVFHSRFGPGTVTACFPQSDRASVEFDIDNVARGRAPAVLGLPGGARVRTILLSALEPSSAELSDTVSGNAVVGVETEQSVRREQLPRIAVDASLAFDWALESIEPQPAPWARFWLLTDPPMAGDCALSRGEVEATRRHDGTARTMAEDHGWSDRVLWHALAAIYDHAASRRRYKPTGRIRTVAGTSDAPERENVIRIDAAGKVRGNLGPEVRRAPRPHERRGHPHTYWVGKGRAEKRVVWLNETRVKGGERGADYRIKP
jgi:hypothetical protein